MKRIMAGFCFSATACLASSLAVNFECDGGLTPGRGTTLSNSSPCSLNLGDRNTGNFIQSAASGTYSIPSQISGNTITATVSLSASALADNPGPAGGVNWSAAIASLTWSMLVQTDGPVRQGIVELNNWTTGSGATVQVGQYTCTQYCGQYNLGFPALPFTLGQSFALSISDAISAWANADDPYNVKGNNLTLSFALFEADGATPVGMAEVGPSTVIGNVAPAPEPPLGVLMSIASLGIILKRIREGSR